MHRASPASEWGWDEPGLAGKRWWSKSGRRRFSLPSESLGSSLPAKLLLQVCLGYSALGFVFSGSVLCCSSFEPIAKEMVINVVVSQCCSSWGQEEFVHSTFTSHSDSQELPYTFLFQSHIWHLGPPFLKRQKERVLTNSFDVLNFNGFFNPIQVLQLNQSIVFLLYPAFLIFALSHFALSCYIPWHFQDLAMEEPAPSYLVLPNQHLDLQLRWF